MTVSSMGMFASGLLSWLACRVFNFAEARAQVRVRACARARRGRAGAREGALPLSGGAAAKSATQGRVV
jgi:hypothetical protein